MSILSSPRPHPQTEFSIVLDMDETLLSAILIEESETSPLDEVEDIYSRADLYDIRVRSFRVPFYDPVTEKGTGIKYDCWGVTRPHLEEFLNFAFKYFKNVVVWSAGRFSYVRRLTREITKDCHRFDLVWTYDDCTEEGYGKPLKKLLEKYPHLGDLSKIFIIDDKFSSIQNNVENGIVIPAYEPSLDFESLREDDDALLKLKKWFQKPIVRNAKDIRTLDKSKIFD
jgi:hypothetical protein